MVGVEVIQSLDGVTPADRVMQTWPDYELFQEGDYLVEMWDPEGLYYSCHYRTSDIWGVHEFTALKNEFERMHGRLTRACLEIYLWDDVRMSLDWTKERGMMHRG